ncbi:MAG: hypothetical protein CFE32_05660 [Alphaproteobacteria bacterium PA3]|nr:MAG: hypothetical protein CFE32_05660 [Alphaproteobacteria bacterium PA3]
MPYTPFVPPHADELTQGYFARMGHFHALVDVTGHMAYMGIKNFDFRDGTDAFVDRVAELTGADRADLARNTLRSFPDGSHSMGGHKLSRLIIRRNAIKVCCDCLSEDAAKSLSNEPKQFIFRKQWLFRQVVVCPVHHLPLVEVPVPDTIRAYDLYKSLSRAYFSPSDFIGTGTVSPPGPLQQYVLSRMDDRIGTHPWLDCQTITQAAKACEMLGCLLVGGPEADVINYTETDWARAGDAGFDLATGGPEAIIAELTRIRTNTGRTSGRTGPQAVFGKLYKWLHNTAYGEEVGGIRHVVREAILWNFPIGPGETIFGEPVERRYVHSANTLINKTGRNRRRFYKLLTKLKFIPEGGDAIATNQYVFPAEEAERVVARIENSVPLNKVRDILGCSKTHEVFLAHGGLITSVVPMEGGAAHGLTIGAYNLDDLSELLHSVCDQAAIVETAPAGFENLTTASRRCSTVSVVTWQRDGQLKNTIMLGSERRFDRLYFDPAELKAQLQAERPQEVFRLSVAARRMNTGTKVLKMLMSTELGEPLIQRASPAEYVGLAGSFYLLQAEIDRFHANYVTLFTLSKELAVHPNDLRKRLDANGVKPVRDPARLKARLYRRADLGGLG